MRWKNTVTGPEVEARREWLHGYEVILPAVSLFIGCLNDIYYPRVGVAVVKILERFGCQVDFPETQTCCGAGMYHDGFQPQAKDLARRFVRIFGHSTYIVTPSPRCCAMVREEYPRLLVNDSEYEAAMWQVAGRTYEFVEFLTTILKADLSKLALPQPASVTYHPACQQRSMGVLDSSPAILSRMKNVDARTLPDADRCCGAGSGLPAKQPEISLAMRDQKIEAIENTGTAMAVCNEALCAMRLGKCKTPIRHIAELMAEGMGINLRSW